MDETFEVETTGAITGTGESEIFPPIFRQSVLLPENMDLMVGDLINAGR